MDTETNTAADITKPARKPRGPNKPKQEGTMTTVTSLAPAAGEFKVEKNVPLPSARGGAGSGGKYPFASMSVGDSFLVRCTEAEKDKRVASLSNAHGGFRKNNPNHKFTVRKVDAGVRCWRIK